MGIGSKLSSALGVMVLTFALSYGVIWCLDPANLPIQSVVFIGERHALSYQELQEAALREVSPGFFRLKASSMKVCLLSLPWLKQVDIRKEWPNKLVIKYEEHTPAARWGDTGIISSTGQLFFPKEQSDETSHLPFLKGPAGRNVQVWQQYLAMKAILAPENLGISQIVMAPRGSWHVKLDNGVTVILGTNDILKRLKRFARVYKTHLESTDRSVAYIDLRYTRGLAVGWKSG